MLGVLQALDLELGFEQGALGLQGGQVAGQGGGLAVLGGGYRVPLRSIAPHVQPWVIRSWVGQVQRYLSAMGMTL